MLTKGLTQTHSCYIIRANMAVENLRVPSAEDYPKGTPIRAILEEPEQKLARLQEAVHLLPTFEQFLTGDKAKLEQKGFTSSKAEFPSTKSVKVTLEIWRRAAELGFTELRAHILPGFEFTKDTIYPPGWVPLEPWYFNQIGHGLDEDAAILKPATVLFDATSKPDYDDGRQLYPNDQFGPLMQALREKGKIEIPEDYKHVPATSRFAATPREREDSFDPALAQILKVDQNWVRVPTAAENNFLANLHYPYIGKTNTSEWYFDHFAGGRRLFGGYSGHGGLAFVRGPWLGFRSDYVAFRPLVVIPSK